MLEEIRKNYIREANRIPDWQTMNKNDLINKCLDNKDNNLLYNSYLSAVILRYWGNIGKYYLASKASGFTIEDCYDWLIEAILYALGKAKWRDPENPLSKDPAAPDKVINRCIYSRRQLYYYLANRGCRKANYGTVNIDKIVEEVGDHATMLEDDSNELDNIYLNSLISSYFKKDIIKGIILNSICYDDCFAVKKDKETKTTSFNFKLNRLSNNIILYNISNVNQLVKKYGVNKDELANKLESIKNMSKTSLNKMIKQKIENLSQDKELRDFLCY